MRKLGLWAALAVAVLGGCKAHHQALPPRGTPVRSRTITLPTGLRLVLEEEPGSKRIAVAVLVGAGSAQDPVDRPGLAHFVEHLAFRSRPTGRLTALDELDLAGVASQNAHSPNAVTELTTTTYLGVAPVTMAAGVLPLMAALVTRPLEGLDDASLEVERGVVAAEWWDRDPHSGGAVSSAMMRALLPSGWLGAAALGADDGLGRVTRADLEAFVAAHYRPENVIVTVVGDLGPDTAAALVTNAFPTSWVTRGDPQPPRQRPSLAHAKVPSPPPAAERPLVEARVPARGLIIAWAMPGESQPGGPLMPLVERALADQLEKPKGVSRLFTALSPGSEVSFLSIVAFLEPEGVPDAVSAELRKLTNFGGFSSRQSAALADQLLFDEQHVLRRAHLRARQLHATGIARPLLSVPADETRAGLETIEKELLTWARAREVLVVPLVPTGGHDTPARAGEPPGPGRQAPRPAAAALAQARLPAPAGEQVRFVLENGLTVVLSRRPSVPLVGVALGLPAGASQTGRDVALLLGWPLQWEFEDDEYLVGRPRVRVLPDVTLVQLSGRSTRLPLMLDVLGHNLPPRVGSYGFDIWNRAAEQVLRALEANPDEAQRPASRGLGELVDRVMGKASSASKARLEDLKHLERDSFYDFADAAWRPDGAWLVIDGDLDLGPTEQLVRELFSDWRGAGARPLQRKAPGPATKRAARPAIIEAQGAAQTTVRFACRVPAPKDDDELAGLQVLADALSTTFRDDLRRARGAAYAVSFHATRFRTEDNALVAELTLDPTGRQAALRRFLEKLGELDGAVWDEQEVDLARWHVAKRGFGTGLRSDERAARVAAAGVAGLPLEAALGEDARLSQAPLRAVDDAWAACTDTLALELEGERAELEKVVREWLGEAELKRPTTR